MVQYFPPFFYLTGADICLSLGKQLHFLSEGLIFVILVILPSPNLVGVDIR